MFNVGTACIQYLGSCRRVTFANSVPVDQVEERPDVIWAAVLIVQVVGVLPDIQPKDGGATFHQWAVLVGCAFDD